MAYVAAEARQELADAIGDVADGLARALALLGAAYEQLDDRTADRLEDELFRPVQAAYGQAQRTVAGFASRHGLAERTFAAGSEPVGVRSSAKDLIDRGVAVAEGADATLAGLQDSLMPIEVGDAELRDAIAGLRTTLAGLRDRAREIERTLGR